jgi:hypothetical protein
MAATQAAGLPRCPSGAVAQLGERLVRNEEVRGSIPLGSTSLRGCAASAGIPRPEKKRRPPMLSVDGQTYGWPIPTQSKSTPMLTDGPRA